MEVGGQHHASAALLPGKTRYPLYRRLGRSQGRSGRLRKISPPREFDPRAIQPVASRYTDWGIPARHGSVVLLIYSNNNYPNLHLRIAFFVRRCNLLQLAVIELQWRNVISVFGRQSSDLRWHFVKNSQFISFVGNKYNFKSALNYAISFLSFQLLCPVPTISPLRSIFFPLIFNDAL